MAKTKIVQPDIQLAIDFFQKNDLDRAASTINEILEQWEKHAPAWFLLAIIHLQRAQFEKSKYAFQKAVQHQKIYPDAYNNLGTVHQSLGDTAEAIKCYRIAIKQNPRYDNAHYNLGQLLQSQGELDEAMKHYHTALKYQPNYTKALNNLAMIYQTRGYSKNAKKYYERALKISPHDPEIINNLGFSFYRNHEYQHALDCFHKALKIKPNFHDAYLNIGLVLQATGDLEAAKKYFKQAGEASRLKWQANHNIAHLELGRENYETGWEYYQFRSGTPRRTSSSSNALPELGSINRILLTKDQGLGDELFFLRFIPELKKHIADISYCCDERLHALLSNNISDCAVFSGELNGKSFDATISIADLPRLLSHTSTYPEPLSLRPDTSRIEQIQQQLPNNSRPNIAITWQAGTQGDNRLFKYIPPEALGQMLSGVDANIIIIQRNPDVKDIKKLEKGLKRKAFNYAYINDSLDDVLAALSIVDAYIGVSNTNMHLMAGLGKSASLFVPHPPEWRWLHQGEISPWFPEFTLCRQNMAGDWGNALHLCRSELDKTF